ncbi:MULTISPECIES: Nif3-like dinuclear metal center hexameric protein [unclassified Halanaerobium]|uniref:Nif3-like dinuclear metal center hexameric protein n=1 Tax=unclassified Halanaerobium TaxID=2641197 RepID=UPI000DF3A7FE|nr:MULTISPECIES: Nif3-like dinuclear metal center hexameric protein [unclassified Halanaerobium]RCW45371.1 dinuclear metal center YbgI/SA1388 family protein [Halanaerobium sp. MA284_MarDTE_T2]RCW82549.1 dinuclear metal center YbgI/SA1388 family protein [Halanaerobium sp. DL-01]
MTKAQEIISLMGEIAPVRLAEKWDNVGLQIGDLNNEVEKILLTLDLNNEVIDEAVKKSCNMIITHHPVIFNGINSVSSESAVGQMIIRLIKNDIIVFSAHTNLDIAEEGLNDYICNKLGIKDFQPLDVTQSENYYKFVVFVPENYIEEIKSAVYENGGGEIGKYSHSGFYLQGKGSFKPLEGSSPYIGSTGKISEVDEIRLETVVAEDKIDQVLKSVLKVHPYEEVAYDIYKIDRKSKISGIGRIGYLKEKILLNDYLNIVKEELNLPYLKFVGNKNKEIKKVAVCNGSGADLTQKAIYKGADLYLTGDVKYHEAQYAEEMGLALIDIGHYESEIWVKKLLYQKLTCYADKENKKDVEFVISNINTNPWNYR